MRVVTDSCKRYGWRANWEDGKDKVLVAEKVVWVTKLVKSVTRGLTKTGSDLKMPEDTFWRRK